MTDIDINKDNQIEDTNHQNKPKDSNNKASRKKKDKNKSKMPNTEKNSNKNKKSKFNAEDLALLRNNWLALQKGTILRIVDPTKKGKDAKILLCDAENHTYLIPTKYLIPLSAYRDSTENELKRNAHPKPVEERDNASETHNKVIVNRETHPKVCCCKHKNIFIRLLGCLHHKFNEGDKVFLNRMYNCAPIGTAYVVVKMYGEAGDMVLCKDKEGNECAIPEVYLEV